MPFICFVSGCTNSNHDDLWSFHRIPKEPKAREIWIKNIGRPAPKNWDHVRICGRHFIDNKPTKANPYPVLHMGREVRATMPVADKTVDLLDIDNRQSLAVANALLDVEVAIPGQNPDGITASQYEVWEGKVFFYKKRVSA